MTVDYNIRITSRESLRTVTMDQVLTSELNIIVFGGFHVANYIR